MSTPSREEDPATGRSDPATPAGSWRYDPTTSRRDLRLDLLRGLCLLKMVTNHIGAAPAMAVEGLIGFATAAEGFFFISGAVVGIVHGRRMLERGIGPTSRQLLERAAQLYVANLALVMLFVSLEASDTLPYRSFSWLWEDPRRWMELLAFNQPYYLHVLPRYVIFLAFAPAALWLLGRGRTSWLLVASWALWAARFRLGPSFEIGPLERPEPSAFPLLSWQVLFFTGMCIGFHRHRLGQLWRRHHRLATGMVVIAWLGFVAFRDLHAAGVVQANGGWMFQMLGREHLGPLRLADLAAVFTLCLVIADRCWRPLNRLAGPLLLPFGQHSLYLFLMHIPVAWLSRPLLASIVTAPAGWWQTIAFEGALVALLWLMIRKRLLFSLVPT